MALSLLDMTTWRASLVEARSRGVRRVRDQSGEEVEYKSDSEMRAALAALDAEIAAATRRPSSTIVFNTNKGLT